MINLFFTLYEKMPRTIQLRIWSAAMRAKRYKLAYDLADCANVEDCDAMLANTLFMWGGDDARS